MESSLKGLGLLATQINKLIDKDVIVDNEKILDSMSDGILIKYIVDTYKLDFSCSNYNYAILNQFFSHNYPVAEVGFSNALCAILNVIFNKLEHNINDSTKNW